MNSFKKAEIIDGDNFSSDEESALSDNGVNDLPEELLRLFDSSSETFDFDGF